MATTRGPRDLKTDAGGWPTLPNQDQSSHASEGGNAIPSPNGLQAFTFQVMCDDYALLAFELPKIAVPPGLSPVEREVVLAVVAGQSNDQVAKARGTSVNTVANQLRSIYDKLQICSRSELIRLCARLGGNE